MTFYVVKAGSEADQRLRAYLDETQKSRKELSSIAAELECSTECFYHSGVRLHSFCRHRGLEPKDPPGGWMKSRLFPARNRANRELIKRIESLSPSPFASPEGAQRALFPNAEVKLRLGKATGRLISYSCGIELHSISDRLVVEFDGKDHVDSLRSHWPNGLRKVKMSTVERWREAEA